MARKPNDAAADVPEKLPQGGGSYTRDANGDLVQVEGPDMAQQPAPPTPAAASGAALQSSSNQEQTT